MDLIELSWQLQQTYYLKWSGPLMWPSLMNGMPFLPAQSRGKVQCTLPAMRARDAGKNHKSICHTVCSSLWESIFYTNWLEQQMQARMNLLFPPVTFLCLPPFTHFLLSPPANSFTFHTLLTYVWSVQSYAADLTNALCWLGNKSYIELAASESVSESSVCVPGTAVYSQLQQSTNDWHLCLSMASEKWWIYK